MKLLAACLATLAFAAPVSAQSAAVGKTVFGACAACHGTGPTDKKIGPTLFGVVGRKQASVQGYAYSPAFKALSKTWTKAELDTFLKAPQKAVPGTKMYYPGVPDDAKRTALIDYLAGLK